MSATKDQKHLIEEIGMRLETTQQLSPLSARIYALLILSSYEGLTFEEIKERVKASKSSISVNLNVLTQLRYIKHYTKPGERKRHFKADKYYFFSDLEKYKEMLTNNIAMIDCINDYNKAHHPEKITAEKSLGGIMQDYYNEQEKLVKKTIEKVDAFRKIDKSF